MKCPECEKQGLESYVTIGGLSSTSMAAHSFYDKEGKYHYHDPNTRASELRCSNGHVWIEKHTPKCWCQEGQE